ncbi:FAD-dependent oxidoreductase [Nocardia sp. 348MFTsu5.1]|uniref:FAD-dependent oxidoreductase n=1 Tax=Nocardia sp. 348MFTsu5.1 TaxID=1172185 RepID=UPI0003A5EE90|nr:FAD-dependent oxidoreductase [Nocardia sp. 348MFTsu5.1]
MTFVILQSCCNEASCVDVCPVDCIHPKPGEPAFMRAEMLHIDPTTCIDCGACVDACPVEAIKPDYELDANDEPYLAINAAYFDRHPIAEDDPVTRATHKKFDHAGLRVAIVGTGPSAFYAARELTDHKGVEVTMFDRLLTPYGLVRAGVAPDHQTTKSVTDVFKSTAGRKALQVKLGVEVGETISHNEILAHYHAVIYAVGASGDRRMQVPGEDLPGSYSATEFVGWYNGQPDYADREFDLSSERAVVVGNGNVALDVARILLSDKGQLETRTDIAEHALATLRQSNIREVVIVGRRGRAQAAYTNPELLALIQHPDINVRVDADSIVDDHVDAVLQSTATEPHIRLKVQLAQDISDRPGSEETSIVLRYLSAPAAILGTEKVEGIRLSHTKISVGPDGATHAELTTESDDLAAGLVLRSIGFKGRPLKGVPFDESRGVIPNVDGRVVDSDPAEVLTGVYTVGWIKRGANGVIGTNRKCAGDTVELLLADHAEGRLAAPARDQESLDKMLADRAPDHLVMSDWNQIDKAERSAGRAAGRPRVKFIREFDIRQALRASATPQSSLVRD